MLLDTAAEEAAAAAEKIPGTVAGKGKEKAEDISEEEDFNFQDILGQELSKAEKEELKEYAISCGYKPGALLFGRGSQRRKLRMPSGPHWGEGCRHYIKECWPPEG
jgi:hypothetical protein